MENYTREQALSEFKLMCADFWGEDKSKQKIKEAWKEMLEMMQGDGYGVDTSWKLTAKEINELLKE